MTTPDLTPTQRKALTKVLDGDLWHHFLSFDELSSLIALRDACPERPRLEDGRYEVPSSNGICHVRYVRGGRSSAYLDPDGTLYDGGVPLPADVSTWRRIDGLPTVTPEQLEAAARKIPDYTESQWAPVSEDAKNFHRNRARKILAAAGIEVIEG